MGLGAITIYTDSGQFWQFVLTAFAGVHYIHPVRLFHMQQPHQGFLAILVITGVPSSGYESHSVGLKESFTL